MTITSEVLALESADGLIRPVDVVKWARAHPRSELHGRFEWDDKKAADEYRLWQARHILAEILTETGTPRFLSLRIDRSSPGGGYRSIEDIMSNADLRQRALADALADLETFEQKYELLKELAGVFAAAKRVRRKAKPKAGDEGAHPQA